MSGAISNSDWNHLVELARTEVETTIRSLPKELQRTVQRLPVLYERRPNPKMVADSIEPDTLGLFVGNPWADGFDAPSPLPAQIILFLENIWELAEADAAIYKREVRTTLLHELGHYLGLNERDLEQRGLE